MSCISRFPSQGSERPWLSVTGDLYGVSSTMGEQKLRYHVWKRNCVGNAQRFNSLNAHNSLKKTQLPPSYKSGVGGSERLIKEWALNLDTTLCHQGKLYYLGHSLPYFSILIPNYGRPFSNHFRKLSVVSLLGSYSNPFAIRKELKTSPIIKINLPIGAENLTMQGPRADAVGRQSLTLKSLQSRREGRAHENQWYKAAKFYMRKKTIRI